jgi:L-serine dehydratase
MRVSVFDLFSVGIGPSSSHTVGPMRAARTFVGGLAAGGLLGRTEAVRAELFGSLAATGPGHGTPGAVLLGLTGHAPEVIDPDEVDGIVAGIRRDGRVALNGVHDIRFVEDEHLVLNWRVQLPYHPNGLRFTAYDPAGGVLAEETFYSIGGGFVVSEPESGAAPAAGIDQPVKYPFRTALELLVRTAEAGLSIADVMLANEQARRTETEIRDGLLNIWRVMHDCIERGSTRDGVLPGGLSVRRRATSMRRQLEATEGAPNLEWVTLFAMAVNEENAAGGRVVTAPTNGAAGIVPAVLSYYTRFVPGADDDGIVRFLLTAGAVGALFKENASISGAEVGCQGEVGSACSMAAAGLAAVLGGTPEQVENAAEIAMEHNLGLTCDPIGGLVQIPCIERNAIASVKAITAARMALRGDGVHHVSLDNVIKTMRDTGADMSDKYKETSRGGLAVNVIEC